MKTIESTIDPQEMADMEEVSRLLERGERVTDPELLRRIRERSDAIRDELTTAGLLVEITKDGIRWRRK